MCQCVMCAYTRVAAEVTGTLYESKPKHQHRTLEQGDINKRKEKRNYFFLTGFPPRRTVLWR